MPNVPIEIPSETAGVPNPYPVMPESASDFLIRVPRVRTCLLQL
jgi:hypothetical protein